MFDPGVSFRRAVVFGAGLLIAAAPAAAEWTDRESGLGVDAFRLLFSAGPNYGIVNGAEVERVDPSVGLRASLAYRVISSFSLSASVGTNTGSVEGQLQQLLDTYFREDRRSATIAGEVSMLRLGVGARLDAFRTQPWRFRPYFVIEGLRTMTEVTVDSVDGAAPRNAKIAQFDSSQWGVLGRAGVDVRISSLLGLDLSGAHEILEFPAGSAGITTLQAGLSARI